MHTFFSEVYGEVKGISADGLVMIGSIDGVPCKLDEEWEALDGGTGIAAARGSAEAINADGSVIVGNVETTSYGLKAVRWNKDGLKTLESLNNKGGPKGKNKATAVSADGSVIIVNERDASSQTGWNAFRWTEKDGFEALCDLNNGTGSYAQAISADNSVIVGYLLEGATQNISRVFRWDRKNGMQFTGDTQRGGNFSRAQGVNADGSIFVGEANAYNTSSQSTVAFRYGKLGRELINTPKRGMISKASCVSADGLVIAGQANDAYLQRQHVAFRWIREMGMESIETLPRIKILLPAHLQLWDVVAMSSSGAVMVGTGYDTTTYKSIS